MTRPTWLEALIPDAFTRRPDDDAALDDHTVADFGDQWTRYQDNAGYYGDPALLADILGPLLPLSGLAGARTAEIGSGTGRIVGMVLAAGVSHVTALEPSDAFEVLARQTAAAGDRVTCVRGRGEDLPATGDRDYVFSIGVLHHIVDPQPALRAAFEALRPGGRMIAWLYGHEGNAAYLLALAALRRLTSHATPASLALASEALTVAVDAYTAACRVLPLPLRAYLVEVLARFPRDKRRLVVYDQLNPAYARYYREAEARALLEDAGFVDVQLYHRHGYSWTVMGTRPRV